MSGLNLANGIFKGITVQAQKRVKTDRIDCLTAGKIKFECPIESENLTDVKTYTATPVSVNADVSSISVSNSTYYEFNGDIYLSLEGSFATLDDISNGQNLVKFNITGIPDGESNLIMGSTMVNANSPIFSNIILKQGLTGSDSFFIVAGVGDINNSSSIPFDFKFNVRYRK